MTPPAANASSEVACVRCGTFVALAQCLYSDQGEVMCLQCRERIDQAARVKRAARILRGQGYAAAFMGFVGLPAAVFFPIGALFMSVPALGAGARTGLVLARDREARANLGWHFGPVLIASIAGLLLGLLGVLMMVFNFIALFRG